MKLDKHLRVENIAKSREDITKKKIIVLYDYLTDISTKFFGKKSTTDISVNRSYVDKVRYDSLDEFQKNFSETVEFESIYLYSSAKIGESISLDISYNTFFNGSEFPVAAYISIYCNNRTEVEAEDLLQEIKEYVCDLFSPKTVQQIYSTEVYVNTDTSNAQPTYHGNEKFWIKHKPLLDFLYLVLGIVISVATIIGLFKSCDGDTVNNEINENHTLYSQQNEISSGADKTSLLS